MSLFGGLFVVFAMTIKRFLFSRFSTDVISETTELGIMFYVCSFPVSFFNFFFSWEQLVLQDFEWCIRGRVVTISDLKEVLKAKTEEKDRQKGGEMLSWGELLPLGTSCQTINNKSFKKTLPET